MRLHTLVTVVAALWFSISSLQGREWTDNTGQIRREAEFVKRDGSTVWFKDPDGRSRSAEFDRLSAADQAYIMERERPIANRANGTKPGLVATTLSYRRASGTADTADSPTKMTTLKAAAPTLMKLTGWSGCTPWYCYRSYTSDIPHSSTPSQDTGKRIYCGHKSTWHLVSQKIGEIGGTGAYWLTDPNGYCRHYLALLRCWYNTAPYLGYQRVGSPGGITYWLFDNAPINKFRYNVYYWNGTTWVYYDCCYREIPN